MTISFGTITKLYMIINLFFYLNTCRDIPYFPSINTSLRVYGGIPAYLGELPYQVAFKTRHPQDENLFYTFCGGAIIGETKLLSAAHCFVGESTGIFTLCYGHTFKESLNEKYAVAATIRNYATELGEQEQWRSLRNVTYPNEYRFPDHDIAILFVTEPFIFNNYVKPIKYANKYEDYEGLCLVSGYGRISSSMASDSLLKAHLLLLSRVWCSKVHGKDMSHTICTSVLGPDIGKGDSGGPLVCTHTGVRTKEGETGVLVGIASGTYQGLNSIFVCLSHNTTETTLENTTFLPNAVDDMWVPRVVNGSPAKKGDVPYQVAMKALINRAKRQYKTFCGATIIGSTKLLTAAHCFQEKGSSCHKTFFPGRASDKLLENKYAVAGNMLNKAVYHRDSEDGGQWRVLHSVVYPKKYKFPIHDIAVAYVKKPYIFSSTVQPIPIATRNTDYHGKCLVSGFGRIGHGKKDQTEILLLAHLDLMPKQVCNKVHRKKMDMFVCTSSKLSDVGKGDSGGPLVCSNTGDPNEKGQGVLVGVVSGHSKGRGSFFTRVSRYTQFVSKSDSISIFMFNSFETYTAITVTSIYRTFFLF